MCGTDLGSPTPGPVTPPKQLQRTPDTAAKQRLDLVGAGCPQEFLDLVFVQREMAQALL